MGTAARSREARRSCPTLGSTHSSFRQATPENEAEVQDVHIPEVEVQHAEQVQQEEVQVIEKAPLILKLNMRSIKPFPSYMANFGRWMFENKSGEDDPVIEFKYHPSYDSPSVFIHESRLEWTGGKFESVLRTGTIDDSGNRVVHLAEQEDPRIFGVLKNFLYSAELTLQDGLFAKLLSVAQSAERWGLVDLFRWVCVFVVKTDPLNNMLDDVALTEIADMTKVARVPRQFVKYFWRCVGRQYLSFSQIDGKRIFAAKDGGLCTSGKETEGIDVKARATPKFPELWSMAFTQNHISTIFANLPAKIPKADVEMLVQVILLFLEPNITDDSTIIDILEVVWPLGNVYCGRVLTQGLLGGQCSVRAIRLLSMTVCSRMLRVMRKGQCGLVWLQKK